MDLPERWAQKIQVNGSCWEWTGARVRSGYGKIMVGWHQLQAHRVIYEALVGPIPLGLTLDHLCRNRACVNPEHLEPVTLAENLLRGESPPAKNARKTHCANGHEFTPENTYLVPTGGRRCRACHLEIDRKHSGYQGNPRNADKTHCVHGHEFTPENTWTNGKRRQCKTCLADRDKSRKGRG